MLKRWWCRLFGHILHHNVYVGKTVRMLSPLWGEYDAPVVKKEWYHKCPRCGEKLE